MAQAPVRYSTYKPGVKGSTLTLRPGETLAFQAGRGYYAKPAPAGSVLPPNHVTDVSSTGGYNPRVAPPPGRRPAPQAPPVDPFAALSAAEVARRATALANAGLDPQMAEIRRQQALAQTQATADEAALSGFSQAAAGLEGKIAPQVSDAYSQATKDVGALSQGITGQVGADLAAHQAQAEDFAHLTGQGGAAQGVDAQGQVNTLGMLTGVIPGQELAQRGAAAATEAAHVPQIELSAGRDAIEKRMAQAKATGDEYAQQLLAKAAEFPGLKAQALQQLNQYEVDKATYRLNQENSRADNARQNQALHDNEVLAGIKASTDAATAAAEFKYKWASLNFRSAQAATQAKLASQRIAASGRKVNTRLSEDKGYMVDNEGNPVLDASGQRIPVKKATAPGTKGSGTFTKAQIVAAGGTAKSQAAVFARTLAKARQPVPADGNMQGMYKTDPRYKKYGYTDGSTDKKARALKTGDVATARNQMWDKIKGDVLIANYGYTREAIMGWINSALRRSGWQA